MTNLFSQIIEISLSMSALILILLSFSKLLHKHYRASVVVLAWMAIALRLILPWNITLPKAAVNIPIPQSITQPHVLRLESESRQPGDQAVNQVQSPSMNFSETTTPIIGSIQTNTNESPTEIHPSISILQILTSIWILGIFGFILRLVMDYRRVKKLLFLRGQRVSIRSPQGRLLRKQCQKLKMKKVPVLIASRSAPTPMAIGFIKPAIVITPELLDHDNLDLIFMHELIHLKHKDLWKKVLLSAAQAVHWFNPLVWLMNNQAENDIEMACDQSLLSGQDKTVRAVYGRMIVDVIRQTRLPMTAFSTRFSSGKPLKKRIQALFDSTRKRRGTVILAFILFSAGVGSMLVACQSQTLSEDQAEQLLQISRNDEGAEVMFESEEPAVLEIMQKVMERQRNSYPSDPYYYDLKIRYHGQEYLAWTNPKWLYLNDQQGQIGYIDDPYVLFDFYDLIGYEQPEIRTGEISLNPTEEAIAKITVSDINSELQPEKAVNWLWIQPDQYPYFDVFSDLHGEYMEIGRGTWLDQNPEYNDNRLFTFVVHPGDDEVTYPFPEPYTVCFLKGDLAAINGWIVQLDRDYTSTIQELLKNLSETGSHFESVAEEAALKKEKIKNSFPWVTIIEPKIEENRYIYEISPMNLRITINQEVPADIFMIYDRLTKDAGFQYYEWPIDDWMSTDYTHGSYDGYYVFGLFDEPPVDGGYFGDGALLATEVTRFSDTEILCLTSDLGISLTSRGMDYMKSVGFWPQEVDGSSPLLKQMTFEKLR